MQNPSFHQVSGYLLNLPPQSYSLLSLLLNASFPPPLHYISLSCFWAYEERTEMKGTFWIYVCVSTEPNSAEHLSLHWG